MIGTDLWPLPSLSFDCIWFNTTLTAKVIPWQSVTNMCFLAFSHQYQHNFLFKATGYFSNMLQQRWEEKICQKVCINQVSNSQPEKHPKLPLMFLWPKASIIMYSNYSFGLLERRGQIIIRLSSYAAWNFWVYTIYYFIKYPFKTNFNTLSVYHQWKFQFLYFSTRGVQGSKSTEHRLCL